MAKRSTDGFGWLIVLGAVFGLSKVLDARVQTFTAFNDAQREEMARNARYPFVVNQANVPYHVEPIRSPIPGELPPFEDVHSTVQFY